MELTTLTTVTCPQCGTKTEATMPENACVQLWTCPACRAQLRRNDGDCCVFCSHAAHQCPPMQEDA